MVDPKRLELAKQGNLDAIAQLINQSLQTQGITAKLMRHENCMRILLQGADIPPQSLVRWLQTGLQRLQIPQIDRLEIYGKQANANALAWTRILQLAPSSEFSTLSRFPAVSDPSSPQDSARSNPTPSNTKKSCPRPYFTLALLTTFLAFLPLGIAALLFSRRVKMQCQQQDYEGAKFASETAKILCIVGICLASPFYLGIGFIAASYSILTSAQEKQTDALYELQAKTAIEAINRSQQAYWLENSKFATSADQLDLPIQPLDRYRYEFSSTQSDRAVVTATANKPGLKSFTGIVYARSKPPVAQTDGFIKTTPFQTALCAADRPIKPAEIRIEGDRIICPAELW